MEPEQPHTFAKVILTIPSLKFLRLLCIDQSCLTYDLARSTPLELIHALYTFHLYDLQDPSKSCVCKSMWARIHRAQKA